MKTLTLTYPHTPLDKPAAQYRIVQVEQSTQYLPGQFLTKAEVDDLCEQTGIWKIVIKGNPKQ